LSEIYVAILVMSVANFLTRAFPFIFFTKKKPPAFIRFIGVNFPPIILTILIFYTLGEVDFKESFALKEIGAIAFTAILHLWFKNYLISIFVGTIFYMLLVQMF
jgi:branched-subunit amino acid transport protein AzlD